MRGGELLTLPNLVTLSRLALFLPLWVAAAHRASRLLAAGILFSIFTDFLDGFLARRLDQETDVGAKLDSFADNLLLLSAPIWVAWAKPEILRENRVWAILYVILLAAVFLVMFIKFRRNVEIHTYAAKVGVVVTWVFLVHALLFPYSRPFFFVAMALSYIYLVEDLWLLLTRDQIDQHVTSSFSRARRPPDA